MFHNKASRMKLIQSKLQYLHDRFHNVLVIVFFIIQKYDIYSEKFTLKLSKNFLKMIKFSRKVQNNTSY